MAVFCAEFLLPQKYKKQSFSFVIAFDQVYLPHAAAMMHSFRDHAKHDAVYEVIILFLDVEEKERREFESFFSDSENLVFRWVDMKDAFQSLSSSLPYGKMAYVRLALPEILPGHQRVVYLDTDTLLFDDPAKLFSYSLGDAYIAAAYNGSAYYGQEDVSLPHWNLTQSAYYREVLGLTETEIGMTFNSGVMLIDLDRMRKAGCPEIFRDMVQRHYLYADQDILNAVFKGQKHALLPQNWNVENFLFKKKYVKNPDLMKAQLLARRNPCLIHYTDKPFHAKAWRYDAPFSDHYWKYLAKTPYYSAIREKFESERERLGVKKETFADRVRFWLRDIPLVKNFRRITGF